MAKFAALLMLVIISFIGSTMGAPQRQFGFGQFGNQGNLNGATGGRPTTGTGVGNANAGPNGFGAAIGVGGAVATPLGNFAVGQGHSAAVNPGIPFGQFNQFQG